MSVARRDHQRRLAEACVARVDGGAVLEQRLRDRRLADVRREQQRRLAGAIRRAASAPASSSQRVIAASPAAIGKCNGVTP